MTIAGKRPPSVPYAKAIEKATAGAICWQEFFPDEPDAPQE
jgi:hypothetical protein